MRQFFTPKEIAKAAGVSERAINQMATRYHWRHQATKARKRDGRGGGWEYHVSLLPQAAQAQLMVIHSTPANANVDKPADARSKLWAGYEALSKDRKAACEARLMVVAEVTTLMTGGLSETAAIALAAKNHEVSPRVIRNWRKRLIRIERQDWLAALADQYQTTSSWTECDARAWAALKSDFLRPERPAFSACYRRMKEAAGEQGWEISDPDTRKVLTGIGMKDGALGQIDKTLKLAAMTASATGQAVNAALVRAAWSNRDVEGL